jgi:hypothetical protein
MKGNAYVPFMLRRGDGSTLSLDFTAMGGTLDSRFTFTRSSSTSTYIDGSGYVATASADVPRFDYDPTTLTARGLLIEGSTTNYAVSSEAFSTSYWGISGMAGSAPTATSQTNPKNTASCIQFVEDTSTGAHGAFQSMSGLTVGTVYTLSAWVKSDGTRNFASLRLTVSGGSPSYTAVWSLTDGTAGNTLTTGSPTSTARNIVAYPNGWYRIQISMACPTGFTAMLGYVNGSNTNTLTTQPQSYTGVATKGIFVWGAQMEAGSSASASSYIPTGTSNAQRTADTCIASSTGFSSWFTGGTTGTFYADWFGGVLGITSTVRTVLSTSDVTGRHLHLQQTAAAGNLKVADFGAANSVTTSNSITSGARTKGAFSFSGSTVNLTLNGGTVATSSSIAFSTAPTWLVLGGVSTNGTTITDATVLLNGSIRAIKYWPSVLPTATLQSLTA